MPSSTPKSIDSTVTDFCDKVSPGQTPVFLECEPVNGKDQHCFLIVAERVAERGGELVHGWAIWVWTTVLIEAEFHAVWKDPEGNLHDIVPRPDGSKRVLFLADPSKKFEGRQENNIRQAISNRPGVKELIDAENDSYDLLLNRGKHLPGFRIELTDAQQEEYEEIERRKAAAHMTLMGMSPNKPMRLVGRNDKCPCGSGAKFKKCHGT